MAQAENTAGDIHLEGHARLQVGNHTEHNGIKSIVYLDTGAQNSGNINIFVDDRSSGRFHLPKITHFFESLQSATSAFRWAVPVRLGNDSINYVDGLKRPGYDYRKTFTEKADAIHPGTCRWILGHPSVIWWLNRSSYTTLWATGVPGMGKSTLAAYIVQALTEQLRTHQPDAPHAVLYSFCNDKENNTVSDLLCVVLHQLLDQKKDLASEESFEAPLKGLYVKAPGKPDAAPWNSSPDLIWQVFCNLIEESNLRRVFLIVDGLDDVKAGGRVDLLRLLRTGPSNLSIIITSQPMEDVRAEVSRYLAKQDSYRHIDLDRQDEEINADIDSLIESELSRLADLRGYSEAQEETAAGFLRRETAGAFLPVVLIIKTLENVSPQELSEALQSTSIVLEGIEPLYEKLLRAVSENMRSRPSKILKEILKYVMHVYHPLSVAELAFACGYQSAKPHQVSYRRPTEGEELPYQDLRNDLKLLGPILTTRPRDDTVDFIHSTARKYLEQYPSFDASFQSLVVSPSVAHAQIAIFAIECLIEYSDKAYPSQYEDFFAKKLGIVLEENMLLAYALDYWDLHLEKSFSVVQDSTAATHPSQLIETEKLVITNSLQALVDVLNDPTRESFRDYFLAYKGAKFYSSVGELTTLQLSLQLGLHSIAESELEKRREALSPTDENSQFEFRALHWAARSGDLNTYRLLQRHFKLELKGPGWERLVTVAAGSGNAELVRVVLEQRGRVQREVAQAAIEAGNQPDDLVLNVLCEDRTALNSKDGKGMNVLHYVAVLGMDRGDVHTDVIKRVILFLKDCRVDLNEPDDFGNTILHHICWSNSLCTKPLLDALLANGADPRRRNWTSSLPLHFAARKANYYALDCLLSATNFNLSTGVSRLQISERPSNVSSPNEPDNNTESNQQLTIVTSPSNEVRFISDQDAHHFRSSGRLTPLHWAMNRDCNSNAEDDYKALRALLLRGFSLIDRSRTGRSPLSMAGDNWRISHLLCLVYYRLDGAGHFALSLANTIEVFFGATCIDDLWRGLEFDRQFSFLLSGRETIEDNAEEKCIQRALIVYFVFQRSLMELLIPRLITETAAEVLDFVKKTREPGWHWDYTDPKTVKIRQWQILMALQENSDGQKRKPKEVISLERSVRAARHRHLLRILPSNMQASNATSSPTQGLAQVESRYAIAQKTIQKMDSFVLVEDWAEFLWVAFGAFMSAGHLDLLASMSSLALLPEKEALSSRMERVERLTRLRNLLGGFR
ncbi:hypothetical protein BKA64DRAFT_440653 [Cadophora sp. MPI-SDFR-AT-0126]|nr:hypothetical protein BKA64DRAFT_440653 [Leotiomycetes sp. MPI-SDFR-AT-0126]